AKSAGGRLPPKAPWRDASPSHRAKRKAIVACGRVRANVSIEHVHTPACCEGSRLGAADFTRVLHRTSAVSSEATVRLKYRVQILTLGVHRRKFANIRRTEPSHNERRPHENDH